MPATLGTHLAQLANTPDYPFLMPPRKSAKTKRQSKSKSSTIPLPSAGDWRSTDEIEVLRRIQRAREEKHAIANLRHPDLGMMAKGMGRRLRENH